MIEIAMHSDTLRGVSGSFEQSVLLGEKLGLRRLEFVSLLGIYNVTEFGYDPAVNILDNPKDIKRLAEAHGMSICMVDCGAPLMNYKGIQRGLVYVQQAIRFAHDVGCTRVSSSDTAKIEPGLTKEEAFKFAVLNFTDLLKWAEDYGVVIHLETHGPLTNDYEFMYKLFSHFESEYLKLNLDTGNTYISGADPFEYCKALYKYLGHVHLKDVSPQLSDASRGSDSAIGLSDMYVGQGVNADNIKKIIAFLKEKGWEGDMAIEAWGTEEVLRKSVEWVKPQL